MLSPLYLSRRNFTLGEDIVIGGRSLPSRYSKTSRFCTLASISTAPTPELVARKVPTSKLTLSNTIARPSRHNLGPGQKWPPSVLSTTGLHTPLSARSPTRAARPASTFINDHWCFAACWCHWGRPRGGSISSPGINANVRAIGSPCRCCLKCSDIC